MTNKTARENGKILIVLRDAIMRAEAWTDIPRLLSEYGLSCEEMQDRMPARIGFDPHMHTIHSDGQFSPVQLVWWARAMGIKAIGITDHDNITPALAAAIEEGERMGIIVVPGLEYTVNRLGGQSWKGLEVGLHFFEPNRFADFLRTPEGETFCAGYAEMAAIKSRQGWGALERTNEELIIPNGISPISRGELWKASGKTDPVCPSTVTLLVLSRLFDEKPAMLQDFPNTRVIYSHMHSHNLIPPSDAAPQDFDGLRTVRSTLAAHGIKSTLTLNHPEEWLSKCGLKEPDGQPDLPGMRRLVMLMLLHAPEEIPVSFVERYTARNTPQSREMLAGLFSEIEAIREKYLPQLPPLQSLASTDSHRISGFLDSAGELQAWVPGEDFVFGLGAIDEQNPSGSLEVPADYPNGPTIIDTMRQAAR